MGIFSDVAHAASNASRALFEGDFRSASNVVRHGTNHVSEMERNIYIAATIAFGALSLALGTASFMSAIVGAGAIVALPLFLTSVVTGSLAFVALGIFSFRLNQHSLVSLGKEMQRDFGNLDGLFSSSSSASYRRAR